MGAQYTVRIGGREQSVTAQSGDERAEARARLGAVAARIVLLEARVPTWVETPAPIAPGTCVFGCEITLEDAAGRRKHLQIVGVDEAEPAEGRVSFLSPVAQAVLGASMGAVVRVRTPRGEEEWELVELFAPLPPG